MSWRDMFSEAKRNRQKEERRLKRIRKENLNIRKEEREKEKEARKLMWPISYRAKPVLREYAKAMGLSGFSILGSGFCIKVEKRFDDWKPPTTAHNEPIVNGISGGGGGRTPDHLVVALYSNPPEEIYGMRKSLMSVTIWANEVKVLGKSIPLSDFTEDWLAQILFDWLRTHS